MLNTRNRIKTAKVFVILTLAILGLGCICNPPKKIRDVQLTELELSSHVFICEVFEISEDNKTIGATIKESFKGDYKSGQKIFFPNYESCVPSINKTGKWILYGKIEQQKFQINICGISRNLNEPENSRFFTKIPPPPKSNETVSQVDFEKQRQEYITLSRIEAKLETQWELTQLRK